MAAGEAKDTATAGPFPRVGRNRFVELLEAAYAADRVAPEALFMSGDQCLGNMMVRRVDRILWSNPKNPESFSESPMPDERSPAEIMLACGDDARKWAEEFVALFRVRGPDAVDVDLMTAWFASAIEHSHGVRRWRSVRAESPEQGYRRLVLGQASLADVRDAVARGWCHPLNAEKEMDVILAEAIVEQLAVMMALGEEQAKLAAADGTKVPAPVDAGMFLTADIETLCAAVRRSVSFALGDTVAMVAVEPMGYETEIGVAIRLPNGRRHAVVGRTYDAQSGTGSFVASIVAELSRWIEERGGMAPEGEVGFGV